MQSKYPTFSATFKIENFSISNINVANARVFYFKLATIVAKQSKCTAFVQSLLKLKPLANAVYITHARVFNFQLVGIAAKHT